MTRICEHCGSDLYKVEAFDKLIDNERYLRRQRDDALSRAAVSEAELKLERQRHKDAESRNASKVMRQKRRIKQLEAKVNKPHKGVQPWEAVTSYQQD